MAEENKKTAEKKSEQPIKRDTSIDVITPENLPIMYADSARVAMSYYDFKLTFAVTTTLVDGKNIMQELATVILSPLHAKMLVDTLSKNVERYEREVMSLDIESVKEKMAKK